MMSLEILVGLDATTVLAYLDPGMGSMQFQILVAGLLSAGFFLKTHLVHAKHQITRIWKRDV